MCNHSAPFLIIRLHSAESWPKSEASTDGEMIARGMLRISLDCIALLDEAVVFKKKKIDLP